MSITALPGKMSKWKNDSGEIDVFEAAKYFSAANEDYSSYNNNNKQNSNLRGGRMSLDMPMMRNASSLVVPSQTTTTTYHIMNDKKDGQKKYKQPSSPGGRLASFLNSLFNQTSSKKKKSLKEAHDDQSPGGRRKRRSSISHFSFRSTSNATNTSSDSKSTIYSSSSKSISGFRTPPPYAQTPIKSYKGFRNFSDHQKKTTTEYSWLDDNLMKLSKSGGVADKYGNNTNKINGLMLSEKNKTYNKVVDVNDDDGDSDSSSDLFDLPNIDLDCYSSSGLPVYETTHMDNIIRGAPISSGTI